MKKFTVVIYFVISIAVITVTLAFFCPKTRDIEVDDNRVIIRIWQIDTFDGGTGSRANFLKRISGEYTKNNKNVLFLVSSHTVNSANDLIKKGVFPDMISYGSCEINVLNSVKPLENLSVTDGGVGIKKRYAVSWCRGNYFYLTKGAGGKTIISDSERSRGAVAAAMENLNITDYEIIPSIDAYQTFISKKNATLIATQREVTKLIKRGEEFSSTPIKTFNDLYQYVSVTTSDVKKASYCKKFINYLLSDESQLKLTSINMFSTTRGGLYVDNEKYSQAEKIIPKYTVYCLLNEDENAKIKRMAKTAIETKNTDELIKSLKQL